ncbi:MAG: TIGR03617 family F420-dependent LLM class oxidoreductase [Alphaproteobacteria bacterium]|nr:TIGR03617 family F420-dependent LLM class oxidoreductase [Alphaproteobacteria bacterium]
MRVNTSLPYADWRQCGPAAARAEADGFDGVTTPELAHDPFIPLAMAAVATSRVELATSVAIAFPRSPMIVANLAWDLHAASGGRYVCGLGTQVKAHNERRFSVPWISPAPRMSEYIRALRAIWRCWETGEKLNFKGKFYNFTLMTPEFSPKPTGLPMVPLMIAAVGPEMQKAAARHCDGVRLHGFATRKYVEEIVRPLLAGELAKRSAGLDHFEVTGGGFVATGPDEAAVKTAAEKIRYRVAFYGSTPAYRGVFDIHGLSDLGVKLHEASRRGEWEKMAAMVDDDVLDLFCARATYDKLPNAIADRFGGIADAVSIDFLPEDGDNTRRRVLSALKEIPSTFREFKTSWDRPEVPVEVA